MEFLRTEVRRNMETTLAKEQFQDPDAQSGKRQTPRGYPNKGTGASSNKNIPTATGFMNAAGHDKKMDCVFCGRNNHLPSECRAIVGWSLAKKEERLRSARACFKCFRPNHFTNKCKKRVVCVACGQSHHIIMCHGGSQKTSKSEEGPAAEATSAKNANAESDTQKGSQWNTTVDMSNLVERPEVLLQTLTVWIHGERGSRKARAAYDSLSSASYIKECVAKEISLPVVGYEKSVHQTFGGHKSEELKHTVYKMTISGLDQNQQFQFNVSGIPRISDKIKGLPRGQYLEECFKYGVQLTDLYNPTENIEVLIGADMYGRLHKDGQVIELAAGPIAVHTKLGWVLSGQIKQRDQSRSSTTMMVINMLTLDQEASKLWALESIGITDSAETQSRKELEESALKHFQQTVSQDKEGRYEVHLPWLSSHPPIPDNKGAAIKRLQSTTKKLREDGKLLAYHEIFKNWMAEGIIEQIQENNEKDDPTTIIHYLPHRAVYKENSTTPVRPVFDASCRMKDRPSLNDCLEKGPNLLELIPTILNRFRMDKVGVISDIKKAFLQMKVTPADRDSMRFLWWENPGNCNKIVEFRHCRVVFGVSSSPFLLGATLQHHLNKQQKYPETSTKLLKSFYVDNSVLSLPSRASAVKFRKEAQEILQGCQMDLRGWELGPTDENKDVPVLGLVWNLKEDTLRFEVSNLIKNIEVEPTKRNLYSLINMLFDPLGFAAPVVVTAKILLKNVCATEKIGWDVPLSAVHAQQLEKWKKQIPELHKLCIPRYVAAKEDNSKLTLHVCCDASKEIFATCIYLRVEKEDQVTVNLIQAKTKVSPKKPVTIPRLELLSCLIGARLARNILADMELKIPVKYWTDSTTALTWIRKDDVWATFVYRRVQEIRTLSNPQDWGHVPGEQNPADLPSRGCTVKQLLEKRWWSGPDWMYKKDADWSSSAPEPNMEVVNEEKKKIVATPIFMDTTSDSTSTHFIDDLSRLSDYPKMLRVLSYVIRFVNKLKKNSTATETNKKLTLEEIVGAEAIIMKHIQVTGLKSSDMKNFPILKDESGLLRLKSRLVHGEDEEGFKYPIILPGNHPLVKLIVQCEHELSNHAGVQFLQAKMREKYWITKCRRSIRNVIHKCAVCRRHYATRCHVEEGALPLDRIKTSRAFQVTGVDITGPLFVENAKKVWVVLYTCAVYRAIHMELVTSLSTECFLGSLRKFVARRGRPDTIYSDNGTNLVGCANLLKAVNWEEVERYASVQKINWRFNPPTAAWWGGFWERLIGLVKMIMRRTLGSRSIKQAQLEILLAEVEATMNDRPLTYISEDPDDLRPLTPSLFLKDLPVAVLPEVDVSTGKGLRVNLKKIQKLKAELRERFRKEYLGFLINRVKSGKEVKLSPGDVVLVEWDNHKRVDWPMGVIMETFLGKDGKARVAKIKTNKGVMTRPMQRLFPLEVKSSFQDVPNGQQINHEDEVEADEENEGLGGLILDNDNLVPLAY